jgi:hypothetical protein
VKNMSVPESTLSKKHNAINYHVMREAAAMGMLRVGKEDTETNISDLMTKFLNKSRREKLLWNSRCISPGSMHRGKTRFLTAV